MGGAIANGNGETLVSWAGYMCEFREFLPVGSARDANNLTLGNVAYRRESFWAVGGFPAGYFPQEDQIFHQRLCRQGRRLRFDPQLVVAHTHRTDYRAFLKHQRQIGKVNAQVLRQLNLAGAALVRYTWLALLAMPLLIPYRYGRTLWACWSLGQELFLHQPVILWLCWLGMCWWGWGFVEGADKSTAQFTEEEITSWQPMSPLSN